MTKKKIPQGVVICGILCVTAITLFALALGFDGILLTSVIALIAAAIGVVLPQPNIK
jgi:hypothetical protein